MAYPVLYPRGETGWEDKSILLEQNPAIRFPRKKRSYTKRKCKCFVHLIFFQVMLLLFFRYIIGYNIIHGKYAAAVLATPRGSKRTVVDLNPGRAYACTMYIQSIQVEKLCVRPITLSN